MRATAYLPVLAMTLAVGCNGGNNDDTGDIDCSVTPDHPSCVEPEPQYTYSLDAGTSTWKRTVDAATVCDYGFSLTGTEYKSADCPDCDFTFTVAATQTAGDADQGPKCNGSYPFTFPVFETANYGDVPSGIGFVSAGEVNWAGYGYYDATDAFFAFAGLEYGGVNYMALFQPLAGSLSSAYYDLDFDYGTVTPGSGEGSTGDTSLVYNATFKSGRSDTLFFCDDVDSVTEANAWETDPPAVTIPKVGTPDATLDGTIACSGDNNGEVDSFKVTVADDATLIASLDTRVDGHFDARMWVSDAAGCNVRQSDDQFDCSQGKCGEGDGAFMCCPAVEFKNETGAEVTYTIFIGSYTSSCESSESQVDGLYTLDIKGGTALTADQDGYLPEIVQDFKVDVTTSRECTANCE